MSCFATHRLVLAKVLGLALSAIGALVLACTSILRRCVTALRGDAGSAQHGSTLLPLRLIVILEVREPFVEVFNTATSC